MEMETAGKLDESGPAVYFLEDYRGKCGVESQYKFDCLEKSFREGLYRKNSDAEP